MELSKRTYPPGKRALPMRGLVTGSTPEFKPKSIKIIAGLGNPGAGYSDTYHNIGFAAVETISGANSEADWKKAKDFFYAKSGPFIFVKPGVFMNESGKSLFNALRYFKAKPENLLVIHDDSDIESGKYKIGFGNGAAGHKGTASVIGWLKTKDFWRARIGVRSHRGKAGDFILKKISAADAKKIKPVLEELKAGFLSG